MPLRISLVVVALVAFVSTAAADIPPGPDAPPVHRVHVIDREAIAGHTLVGLSIQEQPAHGAPVEETPFSVSYLIVDDFAHDGFDRLCAFPSARVVDSPLGGLGTRMIEGAPGGSGTPIDERENIRRTLALFDADDVACVSFGEPVGATPLDPALRARHIEAIEDTLRPTGVDGRVLHVELVNVAFLANGQPPLVVAALPGGVRPSIPPLAHGGCGCGVARTRGGEVVVLLALVLLVLRQGQGKRSVQH